MAGAGNKILADAVNSFRLKRHGKGKDSPICVEGATGKLNENIASVECAAGRRLQH
jgi:hypothetical protein